MEKLLPNLNILYFIQTLLRNISETYFWLKVSKGFFVKKEIT